MYLFKRFTPLGLATLIILTLLLAGPTNRPAFASLTQCRSDPLVVLSDGTIVDVSADISAALYDVTAVNYTLHIPAGLSVVSVIRTPNWPTTLEQFQVYADNATGQFSSTTVVSTQPSNVTVKANMLVIKLPFTKATSKQGHNEETLSVALYLP